MLGGVVVEREQHVDVIGDLRGGLGPLDAVLGRERLRRPLGMVPVLGLPDLGQCLLRAGLRGLRQRVEHVSDLVEPAALLLGLGEHLTHGLPEPQRTVAHGQDRGPHPAPLAVTQQVRPRLGALTEPVRQRDQLLGPVRADPDHHQQAHLVLLQTDLDVDPVDPHVDVVRAGQGPVGERGGLLTPLRGQPGDRARGQARRRAAELLQRRHEVTAGQAMQVQQRQHLVDLRGLTAPRRQDRRSKPATLTRGLIHPLVVNPRRDHLDRPRGREHLPRLRVSVAHHQPATVLVDLASMRLDIRRDLGAQGRREHRPRTLPNNLVDHRTVRRPVDSTRILLADYREHRRTFPTRASTPALDQNMHGLQIILGKVRPFTSPGREPIHRF